VVEHRDVGDHRISRLLTPRTVMRRRALTFETPKEPLGHRIVQAIALTAHTTTDAVFREQCLIGTTRILEFIPIKPSVAMA
jgi:hypothetical protein